MLADGLGGVIFTVADVQRFEERASFRGSELAPVAPGRFRLEWPKDCETPGERLRYLLDRFSRRPAPVTSP